MSGAKVGTAPRAVCGGIVERAASPFRLRTRWQRVLPVAAVAALCVATASSPSWAATVIEGDHTVSANTTLDDDMTVNGTLTLSGGAAIDLRGHKLTVSGLTGSAGTAGTDNIVQNGSFESSNVSSGWKQGSNCTVDNWTISSGAGVSKETGTWKSVAAPDGSAVLFFQGDANATTTVNVPEEGIYSLTFSYGGRPSHLGGILHVFVNNVEVASSVNIRQTYTCNETSAKTATLQVALAKGENTLRISHAISGGDIASWIDNVVVKAKNAAAVIDSSSDTDNPGELRIVANNRVDLSIPSITFCGNMRLVKDGPNTLFANKASNYDHANAPTYIGGTWVVRGAIVPQQANNTGNDLTYGYDSFRPFGPRRRDMITVFTNGTFDVFGNWCYRTSVVLAGGSLGNMGYAHSHSYGNEHGYGASKLVADSKAYVTIADASQGVKADRKASKFGSSAAGWNDLDLGGHELTVTIKDGYSMYLLYAYITNGTFKTTGNVGILRPYASAIDMRTTTLDVGTALNMTQILNVRDYVVHYTGSSNAGTSALNVYGTFTPHTTSFYGCTLQNGSTMDLRQWPESAGWPMRSLFTSGNAALDFAAGTAAAPSVVNVNLAGRTDLRVLAKSENPYIVTWSVQPSNVDFVLDGETQSAGYRLASRAEGLRLSRIRGFMLIVK